LHEATSDGKQTEINSNKGCLGEFETRFDGEVEAIGVHHILGDITINSGAQVAIARVRRTPTGPGQDHALRVVKAVKDHWALGWRKKIERVPGHSGIEDNERANRLAGEAASEVQKG
jgi:hypothetical protein